MTDHDAKVERIREAIKNWHGVPDVWLRDARILLAAYDEVKGERDELWRWRDKANLLRDIAKAEGENRKLQAKVETLTSITRRYQWEHSAPYNKFNEGVDACACDICKDARKATK